MRDICIFAIMSGFESFNMRQSPCSCGKCGGIKVEILFQYGSLAINFNAGVNVEEEIHKYTGFDSLNSWRWSWNS